MTWSVEFSQTAKRALRRLDRQWQIRVVNYIDEVALLSDPRVRGKALAGDMSGLWRFRIEDFRVICKLEADRLVILVVDVGHRREIYQ